MRWNALASACLASLALAGCGKDAGPQGFPFESRAHAGEGDPIRFRFAPKAGEAYVMKLGMTGSVKAKGDGVDRTIPLDTSLTMTFECQSVQENGDALLSLSMGDFGGNALSAPGAAKELAQLQSLRLTLELDRRGNLKRTDVKGGDPAMHKQMETMLGQVGGRPFLIFPEEGLRVGESLDYAKVFESGGLQQMLGAAGSKLVPDVKGEAVLVKRLQVDGQDAAEFALNLVMNLKGSYLQSGRSVEVDVGLKLTGTQFVAIETGMPLGTMQMKLNGRSALESKGETVHMDFDSEIRIDVTRRPGTPADAPPPAPESVKPGR